MNEIAEIPYVEAQFNKDGGLENQNEINLPAGVTDLFVMSHGWNNDADDARQLVPDNSLRTSSRLPSRTIFPGGASRLSA